MRQITPPAVDGRRHTEVQTELYLEEITDRVEEADIHTQTDAFLDRPPTPAVLAPPGWASPPDQNQTTRARDMYNTSLALYSYCKTLYTGSVKKLL